MKWIFNKHFTLKFESEFSLMFALLKTIYIWTLRCTYRYNGAVCVEQETKSSMSGLTENRASTL